VQAAAFVNGAVALPSAAAAVQVTSLANQLLTVYLLHLSYLLYLYVRLLVRSCMHCSMYVRLLKRLMTSSSFVGAVQLIFSASLKLGMTLTVSR
jgi:hypothetical protein